MADNKRLTQVIISRVFPAARWSDAHYVADVRSYCCHPGTSACVSVINKVRPACIVVFLYQVEPSIAMAQ